METLEWQEVRFCVLSPDRIHGLRLGIAYCGGHQCGNYPGFVETMYLSGLIKAPALSFYQVYISADRALIVLIRCFCL